MRIVLAFVLSVGLIGCGGSEERSAGESESVAVEGVESIDIDGRSLEIECSGEGSPTVVLISGLNSDRSTWNAVVPDVASVTKVCSYDRAGLGNSEPSGERAVTAGSAAAELGRLLEGAGVEPPYVLAGHSYGGMIARAFAVVYRDEVAGLALVDSAVPEQFADPLFADVDWVEAGVPIDTIVTRAELDDARAFDDLPLVVFTQGRAVGAFNRVWTRYQNALANISEDSVHVVARDSDHFIQEQQPDLVVEGIKDVVAAVQSGTVLEPCGSRYRDLAGECV